ncbi:hypothetical protein QYE76_014461 [Lolium multiflorum]|uniref:CBM20 domain-containing protein n=1 Tax=Lolium multiflorum TaxID=4521 RepID=A0AAD8U4S5_LOLMU|nr:hypothetical protein QYE76_014461 [Lolium multiflorum]
MLATVDMLDWPTWQDGCGRGAGRQAGNGEDSLENPAPVLVAIPPAAVHRSKHECPTAGRSRRNPRPKRIPPPADLRTGSRHARCHLLNLRAPRVQGFSLRAEMKSPFLDPAAAAAPIPRGGALGRVRVACGATRVPRRVVGAGLARPGPGRPSLLVAALPEPLDHLLLAQEGPAAPAPEADEVQSGAASAEIELPPAVHETTVRVRFVLREQCTFGHSFHLVGDDPALGLWDPASAAALEWSEGHDWTVQKDLPANRLIEFKFLLRDSSGEFQWQNGPNRRLQTGKTTNTLVVYEDWGDEKNQKLAEEGDVPVEIMAEVIATDDDDKSINDVVAANELQLDGSQEIKEDESSVGDDESSAVADIASAGGESVKACEADQSELVMDEQNIQDDLPDEVDTAPQNDSAATYADDDYGESANDDSILSKDGVLVRNEWTRAFERELLWGWKSLQQLLGFKMDTT